MEEQKKKLSMIVMSGDMDKVFGAFTIASGAAAMGMDVTMFFTFWGIKAIQKGNLTGSSLFGKMLGIMNRGGVDAIGPSRLNMGGLGRWLFKKMMRDKGVASLKVLRDACLEMDVKMLACQMSMDVMEIREEDLIPEAKAGVGVAVFLAEAAESQTTLFI